MAARVRACFTGGLRRRARREGGKQQRAAVRRQPPACGVAAVGLGMQQREPAAAVLLRLAGKVAVGVEVGQDSPAYRGYLSRPQGGRRFDEMLLGQRMVFNAGRARQVAQGGENGLGVLGRDKPSDWAAASTGRSAGCG